MVAYCTFYRHMGHQLSCWDKRLAPTVACARGGVTEGVTVSTKLLVTQLPPKHCTLPPLVSCLLQLLIGDGERCYWICGLAELLCI